jgi:hypothetical protein
VNTSSSRRPAARATSIGNRSSVARSAHCTSSNASISGALAARRPTTPSISSSSRAGSRSSAEIAGVLSSSSGTSRPTSARAEPSAASSSPAGSSAAKSRIISTTGANGIPPPSSSMQLPTRTRAPAWRASPTSSWTSRDLPTPRLPAHHDRGLLPGQQPVQGMAKGLHLPLSPHQDGADQTHRHDVMMPEHRKARRGLRAGLHVPYGLSGRKSYD